MANTSAMRMTGASRTLRFQLIAIVVLTVAVVLTLSQWVNTRLSARALEQDMRERALLVLRTVDSLWGRTDPIGVGCIACYGAMASPTTAAGKTSRESAARRPKSCGTREITALEAPSPSRLAMPIGP